MNYSQGGQNIRLIASYEGIGPIFKIRLELQNLNKTPMLNTNIVLNMDPKIYRLRGHAGQQPFLSLMLPNIIYKIDVEIENIDETGQAN